MKVVDALPTEWRHLVHIYGYFPVMEVRDLTLGEARQWLALWRLERQNDLLATDFFLEPPRKVRKQRKVY